MINKNISQNLFPVGGSLKDAMAQLNKGVGGVLCCVDENEKILGILTDGDIRRALLAGKEITDSVEDNMNCSFTAGKDDVCYEENIKKLTDTIRHLPILDKDGHLVDLIFWADVWHLSVTEPSLNGNEMKYVMDCISTTWISSQGKYIDKFQDIFVRFLKGGEALCTSSGTTALHLALAALGIGSNDEVIVPNTTFGATANVVIHAGATPIFVDICPKTWTIDPKSIEAAISSNTKAIIPVHLYGHPCDMDPIMDIAKRYNLKVIEDCAESLGAEYKGKKVGLIGDVGCFSFFANKVITTGEGGMCVSRNNSIVERMKLLRDHGMSKEKKYWHLEPGFNYRMTNMQAAIGLAQMESLDNFLKQRNALVACYDERLSKIDGIRIPPNSTWAKNIHWLYSIEIDESVLEVGRDQLSLQLMDKGIDCRPVFPPLHLQPAYGSGKQGTFPCSENFAKCGLSLPTSNSLSVEDAERVCDVIEAIVNNNKLIEAIHMR